MLQPTTTILANASGRDIGSVYSEVEKAIAKVKPRLKPGNRIEVAGQAQSMTQAYAEMFGGIALAAVLVYLIMVVNFQSWLMPLIAMGTQPVAVSGALFALWVDGYAALGTGVDRNYHGDRRGVGEQRSGDELCARPVQGRS